MRVSLCSTEIWFGTGKQTKNEHCKIILRPPQFQKVSHLKPSHQRPYVQNFEALSLAIPEKLDGSFLMN
jgi:hypothetical protein